jgi:hypothetical protein
MIIGFTGFAFKPGSGFPAYGTFISDACTAADGYDYNNTYWSGSWNYSVTRADGVGGSYITVENSNANGCYIPSGWVYSSNYYDLTISYAHGPNSGYFTYGSHSDSTYADGNGGSFTSGGDYVSAEDGYVVSSYGFTDGATYYPMTSYLKFSTATNTLNESSYIDAGTAVGSSCAYGDLQDAQGTVWGNVYYLLTAYADGNGGSYYGPNEYNNPTCGYIPNGFYTSYNSTNIGFTYYDEYGNPQNFDYGNNYDYYQADGFGNSNGSSGTNIWYSYGYVFYSYYDYAGNQTINYAFDGYSGHYTYFT